jgi:hypothetical protein
MERLFKGKVISRSICCKYKDKVNPCFKSNRREGS